MMGRRHFTAEEINVDMVPRTPMWRDGDSEGNLARLARSLDGYKYFGTDDVVCLTLNTAVRELFATSPRVLSLFSVTGLRVLLFAEWRCWVHDDGAPAKPCRYARALASALRSRLRTVDG